MTGYSPKSLAEKLGLQPHQSIVVINKPEHYEDLIKVPIIITESFQKTSFIHIFVTKRHDLENMTDRIVENLEKGGTLWVSWQKKIKSNTQDISESDIRSILLPTGLVDVKVAAIDETWSGLKFVWRKK